MNIETMQFWSGKVIEKLNQDEVFLYGSNVFGVNGAGAAKAAMQLGKASGAKNGVAHGFNGTNTYALLTKIIEGQEGAVDPKSGFVYNKSGYRSVSKSQISDNINDLYEVAKQPEHKDKKFLISYQYESWPNGSPKKSLNGYDSQEMLEMFVVGKEIPPNIIFHDSYKPHLEKILANKKSNDDNINNQTNNDSELLSTKVDNSLKKQDKVIRPNNPNEIAFTKVSLPFGWMGNMSPYPVTYEGKQYRNTEALFQALRFVGFSEIQQQIMDEKSPMAAKFVAKGNKHFLERSGYVVMGDQDVNNMRLCVRLKLEQHPDLAKQLVSTGDMTIIEDCTSRPQGSGVFWGAAWQNGAWVGENVLGNILMDFRKELKNNLMKGDELTGEVKSNLSDISNSTNTDNSNNKNGQHIEEKEVKSNIGKNTKEYTYFFHLTSPFSNFHPSKFEYKGLTFVSNEQFMMYAKAKTFKDDGTAEKIIGMNKLPLIQEFIGGKYSRQDIVKDKMLSDQWNKLMMKVKYLGREVKNYDESVWNSRREKVVLFGLREKFTQNSDLMEILLATGDTLMCESSPYDRIWGSGLSEGDSKRTPPERWPGLNLLGKLFDVLKSELSLENKSNIKFKV